LQFILKFPYTSMDERMRVLQRQMGPGFSSFYEGEARTRSIQMAGRVGRGHNSFGCTICLDIKSYDDYMRNKMKYPDWYRERVDERVY